MPIYQNAQSANVVKLAAKANNPVLMFAKLARPAALLLPVPANVSSVPWVGTVRRLNQVNVLTAHLVVLHSSEVSPPMTYALTVLWASTTPMESVKIVLVVVGVTNLLR
jgi:hypothetical protein